MSLVVLILISQPGGRSMSASISSAALRVWRDENAARLPGTSVSPEKRDKNSSRRRISMLCRAALLS
jgi:hypothetical protein